MNAPKEGKEPMRSRGEQPVLEPPPFPGEQELEAVAWGGLALAWLLVGLYWSSLPEQIPTHFDLWGRPNHWGSKVFIFLFPGLGLFHYVLFTLIQRHPHRFNYPWPITPENAVRQYRLGRALLGWLKVELIALFTLLEWGTLRVALGRAEGIGVVLVPAIGAAILATIGLYFYAAYRAR
jgi:hypothetical protein